ncbi:SgcJ/EcaC family oxidoreductase [Micromonospora gifhornensis]|uniref:SgcJ/EcaC family oxidoreductase n=1 Tax=Micromonospora gifhornensis TaxID=84594 RepID=UPI0034552AAC
MSATVSYADEAAIRDLYQRMLDSWGDAIAYAECFTPDADYIIANGMIERGWKEIVDGHEIIFTAWARNSRLIGQIESIRFLTNDVALLIAYGHIEYLDHRSSDGNKRTVYSLVAQRLADRWLFAAYQNTPLGGH